MPISPLHKNDSSVSASHAPFPAVPSVPVRGVGAADRQQAAAASAAPMILNVPNGSCSTTADTAVGSSIEKLLMSTVSAIFPLANAQT